MRLFVGLLVLFVVGVAASLASTDFVWQTTLGANGTIFGDPLATCDEPHGHECFVVVLTFDPSLSAGALKLNRVSASSGQLQWSTSLGFVLPLYSGWVAREPPRNGTSSGRLFVGTLCGVDAYAEDDGKLMWRFTEFPCNVVPAHPTFAFADAAKSLGIVVFTMENGVNSSNVVALRSSDGSFLYRTNDIAYTLIWSAAAHQMIIYGSAQFCTGCSQGVKDIKIVARDVGSGATRWSLAVGSFSPPGLWDNPNLDVDEVGLLAFVYTKPAVGYRNVICVNTSTGESLWNLPTSGHVGDYDTYAYANDFFRLFSVNNASTVMAVQRFVGASVGRVTSVWETTFANSDTNSILLVGGGFVFSFGLSSNLIVQFSAVNGTMQRAISTTSAPTTGVVVESKAVELLVFGGFDGVLRAMSLS